MCSQEQNLFPFYSLLGTLYTVFFFFLKYLFPFICLDPPPINVGAVPAEARGGQQIPWNCDYMQIVDHHVDDRNWTQVPWKRTSALNYQALSLDPKVSLLTIKRIEGPWIELEK